MKNKDIEKLLGESPVFSLRPDLKDDIIQKAEGVVAVKKQKRIAFRKIISIAACFLILFSAALTGFTFYYENYETVYIDVNPSVELSLNRFERVISVNYINEDAEQYLGDQTIKGKTVDDAIDSIIYTLGEKGVLDDADMSISVFSDKNKNCDVFLTKLKSKAEESKSKYGLIMNIIGEVISKSEKKDSEEIGISPAKYKFIREIIEKNANYTYEQLKDLTIKQLRDLFLQLCGDDLGKDDSGKDDPGKDDPGKDDPGKDDPGKDDKDKGSDHTNP